MGNVMMLILGLLVGFLCAAYAAAQLVKDEQHKSYHKGLLDGMKAAQSIWENQMKENVVFAKDAEEVSENADD